jgi:hypothetical protein
MVKLGLGAWTWRSIPESNTKEYLQRAQTSSLGPGDDDLRTKTRKRPGLGNGAQLLSCVVGQAKRGKRILQNKWGPLQQTL